MTESVDVRYNVNSAKNKRREAIFVYFALCNATQTGSMKCGLANGYEVSLINAVSVEIM